MEEKIKFFINKVRPIIQTDGGDVMFVDLNNGLVKICLTGQVCRVKAMEKYLMKKVPEIKRV
ncbi:MAG: NifU family protein, partial [bacterium]|nr:NifU family protein [bacterium]